MDFGSLLDPLGIHLGVWWPFFSAIFLHNFVRQILEGILCSIFICFSKEGGIPSFMSSEISTLVLLEPSQGPRKLKKSIDFGVRLAPLAGPFVG